MQHKKVKLSAIILFSLGLTLLQAQTIKDFDGNVYKTVTVGTQTWISENLRTTKYNDGTAIPLVPDNAAWAKLSTPAYCWYNNDEKNKTTYGALYNGFTVYSGNLCPSGWHVSTDTEWSTLVAYLGGESISGGKLKESGTEYWATPNYKATNETGFTALPGGSRYSNGSFYTIKNLGYWWSSTENNTLNAWYWSIYFKSSAVSRNYSDKQNGFSVRCIKDN